MAGGDRFIIITLLSPLIILSGAGEISVGSPDRHQMSGKWRWVMWVGSRPRWQQWTAVASERRRPPATVTHLNTNHTGATQDHGPDSISRYHLTSIGNPIVEIRRSQDRLISTMGISYTGKTTSLFWIGLLRMTWLPRHSNDKHSCNVATTSV